MEESERLSSLVSLGVLDTKSESVFDGLVQIASVVCNVPIGLVSLIDAERQWFKANIGLPAVTQTPREHAFCAHTIAQGGILEVPDATADPRFSDNPLVVGEPNIRFYAGAPLALTNGARIGTLCVIDKKPNTLNQQQRFVLSRLAAAAAEILESRKTTLELCLSESRFRALCDGSPYGVFATDVNGVCTYTNTRWEKIFGLSSDKSLGELWNQALHEGEKNLIFDAWKLSIENGDPFEMEFRAKPEGDMQPIVRAVTSPVHDNNGKLTGHVGSVEDVTEVYQQRKMLAEQHELLQVTLSSIGDAVITTNANGLITWLNPIAETLTGWNSSEANDKRVELVFDIVDEDTRQSIVNPVKECLATGKVVTQLTHTLLVSRKGMEIGIENSAAPILDKNGNNRGAVLVFRDVTDARRLSNEMRHRATHDSLTGLLNRSELESRLLQALQLSHEAGSVHALMYIDLDRFKLVNDTCGHSVGDLLLKQMSEIFKDSVRSTDAVARIGGDEFAIILHECTVMQAQRSANQIRKKVDEYRFTYGEQQFHIGTSIGLVPLDSRWISVGTALQAADRACYAAKESGRNRVNLWLDTDNTILMQQSRTQWANRIQRAIDNGDFELYAQRIEDLCDPESGVHFEILLRMKNRGQLITPDRFLPAAERFQLSTQIDLWVLKRSLCYLLQLPDLSGIQMIGINISGQSIGDSEFHDKVTTLLDDAGDDICRHICFEITETAAITNLLDASKFIDRMRELGVRIALDDFGAGASSFSYLKRLNVDILKIDGHYINGMIDDELDASAVRCFVDVAGILGLKTVAEFVKSEVILEQVKEMGIDYAQGYLLHKPESIDVVLSQTFPSIGKFRVAA